MSAHDAASQLGGECGEKHLVVVDRGRLVVTAPDATSAKNVRVQIGGKYHGYAVTVRERVKSGIPRVKATIDEPWVRQSGRRA